MLIRKYSIVTLILIQFVLFPVDHASADIVRIHGFSANNSPTPEDVSNTGIVVGSANDINRYRPFYWTQENGIDSFGSPEGGALSISADGSAVVGYQNTQFSPPRSAGFVSRGSNFRGTYGQLIRPTSSTRIYSAFGISDDANIVAGSFIDSDYNYSRLVRWNLEHRTFEDLGTLSPGSSTRASEISGDGRTIIGIGSIGGASLSIRHTDEHGIQSLGDLANGIGSNRPYAVSADGRLSQDWPL